MTLDYQCVTDGAVASSRLLEFVSARRLQNSAGWIRDMVTQMRLWHIGVAEPPCEPRQIDLEHLSMSYRRGRPRKSMAYQGSIGLTQHRLSSGDAVRRSSLRCAPFGPPTVSCVLAPARTCLRQAPPTSRGRGLATSAVPHHLTDSLKYCQSGYKIIKKEKFSTHPIC